MNYVFICTGNICRSPMAEGIAQKLSTLPGVTFSSMGIGALERMPADPQAVTVCAELGVDIASHRARGLIMEELLQAERIFCMDQSHYYFVSSLSPSLKEKCCLLTNYPRKRLFTREIWDPYRKSLKHFRKNRDLLYQEINRLLTHL